MLDITIKTIPNSEMRYPTCGDYWQDYEGMQIRVSDMGNYDYELLVAVHELLEQHLCKKRGIKEEDITAFDIEFEKKRYKTILVGRTGAKKKKKIMLHDNEPGDDLHAPYRKEHFFATSIERLVAQELGVDWQEYEKAIDKL